MIKSNSLLPIILFLIPLIGVGQTDCKNEPIYWLQLDLTPAFDESSTILIQCDSSKMKLHFKTYNYEDEKSINESHEIPAEIYKDFKELILLLDINSMQAKPNLYLADGLTAEITFIDRFENFNKFEMRIPMEKGRNLVLIKAIISLAKKLEIKKETKEYLNKIGEFHLKY